MVTDVQNSSREEGMKTQKCLWFETITHSLEEELSIGMCAYVFKSTFSIKNSLRGQMDSLSYQNADETFLWKLSNHIIILWLLIRHAL